MSTVASVTGGATVEGQSPEESLTPLINREKKGEGITTTTTGAHRSPLRVPGVATTGGVDVVLLDSKEKSIELASKGGGVLTTTEERAVTGERSIKAAVVEGKEVTSEREEEGEEEKSFELRALRESMDLEAAEVTEKPPAVEEVVAAV